MGGKHTRGAGALSGSVKLHVECTVVAVKGKIVVVHEVHENTVGGVLPVGVDEGASDNDSETAKVHNFQRAHPCFRNGKGALSEDRPKSSVFS